MAEVKIEVVNTDLEEMGVDQNPSYIPFRFNGSHFIGYWVDTTGATITFYVGDTSFVCRNNPKNVTLFESLIND